MINLKYFPKLYRYVVSLNKIREDKLINFDGVTVFTSLDILKQREIKDLEKIKILKLISYQSVILNHLKFNKPTVNQLLNIFKYEENLLEELSFCIQDYLIKYKIIFNDKSMLINFISYFKINKKKQKKLLLKKNNLYILVGAPCSRKSTWVKKQHKEFIVLNKDSCVEQVGRKYGKNNYDDSYSLMFRDKNVKKEIKQLEDIQVETALKSFDKDIVIDNPNLKIKNRKEWIKLFKNTHCIKVIVFLVPFKKLIECSDIRSKEIHKSISEKDIISKLKTFKYPILSEGIDIVENIFY